MGVVKAYEGGEAYPNLVNRVNAPGSAALRRGRWVTKEVTASALYRVCQDLADRLGITQGFRGPMTGWSVMKAMEAHLRAAACLLHSGCAWGVLATDGGSGSSAPPSMVPTVTRRSSLADSAPLWAFDQPPTSLTFDGHAPESVENVLVVDKVTICH